MAFQLALTAGLPMLAVVAMQMPLEEFLGYVLDASLARLVAKLQVGQVVSLPIILPLA